VPATGNPACGVYAILPPGTRGATKGLCP
jgi:hypothetical protein